MRQALLLVLLCLIVAIDAVLWDANGYPNPTTQAGAKKCGLRSAGQLCDPDGILSEGERYRVNHELSRLESKTYQEFGRNFCEKKGLTTILALAKNVKGGTESDVRKVATDLRQLWGLDNQCMKGLVILVSIEDKKFWVSRDSKVPVYANEFNEILNAQTQVFRQKNYQQALLNIIQQTADKTLSKQGQLPAAPSGPVDDGRGSDRKEPARGSGGPGFKFPNIPLWVILAIVCVVIPTLICCCCIYCCCCRGKNEGNRRQGPSDEDPEGQRMGGSGGFGDRIRSIAGGAGGGMLMSMIQNCLRNRGSGGSQPPASGPSAGNRGGYMPPRPQAEEGKGLYPSKEVQDDGAGGGW
ncbi:hypothetical protein M3Y97_00052200 [Aphelenchoides bicaudatus]|nr:hypothetical protein M3Y97_00052200 [Aphelenchoides bicaudatus]